MCILRNELIISVTGVFGSLSICSACFVVEELELHLVAAFCQPFLDGVVGFYTVFFSVCIELCLEYDIEIALVCNHEVLIAAL